MTLEPKLWYAASVSAPTRDSQSSATTLLDFLEEAKRRGCYTNQQHRLLRTATETAIFECAKTTQNPKIADVENGVRTWFAKRTPVTQVSYRSRLQRALADYHRWANNMESWARVVAEERVAPSAQTVWTPANPAALSVVPLRLPDGREGEVRYPSNAGPAELWALAEQLRRLAELLATQAESIQRPAKDTSDAR